MSKARKTLKYSAAGTITTIYGLALYRMLTRQEPTPALEPVKAVVTVSSLIGMTWLATSL